MLRISEYLRVALKGETYRVFGGVILIWNITNRCNLYCKHCYSSANLRSEEELKLEEIKKVIPQLLEENIRFVVVSGGEPLLREDLWDIADCLKEAGLKTYLSTNGLLINKDNVKRISQLFDYVGISIDGTPEVHDSFRGRKHAFEDSLNAINLCLREGIKVGLRYTLTLKTLGSLPFVFDLAEELGVSKIYISHLVYAGRASRLKDVEKETYREAVDYIIEKALHYYESGINLDVVTGNNEADAVLFYKKIRDRYPKKANNLLNILRMWGGNQAGVRLVNIDHKGNVKPDPFFLHSLGNVREKPFGKIWKGNGLLQRLREKPRRLKGKCSSCAYIGICNGNSRARAFFATGDYFEEDPACYI